MDDSKLRQNGQQYVPQFVAVVNHELRILHYLVDALVHILCMLTHHELLSLLCRNLMGSIIVYLIFLEEVLGLLFDFFFDIVIGTLSELLIKLLLFG